MSAQAIRLAVSLCAMAAAVAAFLALPGWTAWMGAGVTLAVGGAIAEFVFRRIADAETLRADLEDRVRNPPLG